MKTEDQAPQTFEKLSRQQLEIYAKELREHVQSEHRLRQELQVRNEQLEQRVREITALNQLFHRHLEERQTVVEAYRKVLEGLRELASGATGLEGGILKKCVNGQAVYPLSEQDGLKAQERRYTAYGKEKH